MNTKKNTCEVAIHFNKETHVLSDFSFVFIEQKFAISVITIASTAACLQEKLSGVLNFALSNLTG